MMDLTLRTATQTQIGASENKSKRKAAGGDFANLNALHFSGLEISFSSPVDVTAQSVDYDSFSQPSELSEFTLSEPEQNIAGAAVYPVMAEPALNIAGAAVYPVMAEPALNIASAAVYPVMAEPALNIAGAAVYPVKAESALNIAGAAVYPLTVEPPAVFAQVERLVLANKLALSPSSSLAFERQDTFSRSARVGDAIRLSNSNLNMQTGTYLPVNHSVGGDNVIPNPAILASPALSVDNPAGKTIEWAKVDLTHAAQQIESKEAASSRMGEKLLGILHDRINLQASNNIKIAQIRLDPPDLGMITLNVRVDGDKVNVNIASQSSVVREALIQTSERLRHDLVSQNFVNVSVDISSGEQRQAKKEYYQQSKITTNIFNPNVPEFENGCDEFSVKV